MYDPNENIYLNLFYAKDNHCLRNEVKPMRHG